MEDDFETYRTVFPTQLTIKQQMMMTNLKKKDGVTKRVGICGNYSKFDWKNLRENYMGKIFNVDQLVENLNTGLVGKVIRRGT